MLKTRTVKTLLLDFDGTLVDSVPLLYQFYLDFLSDYGCLGSEEEFQFFNGYSASDLIEQLKQRHGLQGTTEELLSHRRRRLFTLYERSVDFFPGTAGFLERARTQGLSLAIVSSADGELIDLWINANRKERALFDHIVTPQPKEKAKPDPALYLRALSELGLAPQQAVAVEDSIHGMHAALRAGIPTVAVLRLPSVALPNGITAAVQSWEELEILTSSVL